ncbi:nuclear transport factor 2 family protein [Actinocrispum wychmicini]|uniref:Ketosteroid isomerase-like protein n=1 Tax=Actinocrispum wychmicini TaxID=1213861 RepID=A0A4R2K7W6_9PSEU|nr:nuclear transport factor 2 family protein [Actinocrispum wychmicini]TCO62455.1 ketosteroid isomerase-like protein [Actinocrispum wychmicini]
MSQPASPREVAESLSKRFRNRSWAELSELYDENAVVEHPFALPQPMRTEGRAALHERFLSAPTRPFEMSWSAEVIYQTDDPEVVIMQYDSTLTAKEGGKTVTGANLLVIRVRDGRIVHSVDFHNHAAFATLME